MWPDDGRDMWRRRVLEPPSRPIYSTDLLSREIDRSDYDRSDYGGLPSRYFDCNFAGALLKRRGWNLRDDVCLSWFNVFVSTDLIATEFARF